MLFVFRQVLIWLTILFAPLEGFEKVVIWGHKLHSHTHSYIHNGFYMAFNKLGYSTYWFDDQDDIQQFDFSNSLFIAEGQADHNIPLRSDCCYMLHNCEKTKYQSLNEKNVIFFQVYTDGILTIPELVKVDDCIYYDFADRCLYMPWATDLLPNEIEEIKKSLPLTSVENCIYWIGTIGEGLYGNIQEVNPFIQACQENGIEFVQKQNVDLEEHIESIRKSYMAPTIVGKWQIEQGYIPCRIFKNISYGKMGVTNSYRVYELFGKKIVYHPDTYQMFFEAQRKIQGMTLGEMYELIDLVKTKHTYLNRIEVLLNFLNLVQEKFISS